MKLIPDWNCKEEAVKYRQRGHTFANDSTFSHFSDVETGTLNFLKAPPLQQKLVDRGRLVSMAL